MKRFLTCFCILLCACTSEYETTPIPASKAHYDTASQYQEELQTCPKIWTDELNNRRNCKTDELAGMKFNTCYQDNKRNGLECIYFENGVLYTETTWKDDKKNGPDIEYYENGTIKKFRTMADNEMHGVAKGFYPDGNLMFDGFYNGFCDVKYGICYTESGIAVPLSQTDLTNCYNTCDDVINRDAGPDTKP